MSYDHQPPLADEIFLTTETFAKPLELILNERAPDANKVGFHYPHDGFRGS